jgi:hypothetical protein
MLKMEEKMCRPYFIIVILNICFILQGCATLEYLDGSSKKEIKKYKMSKDEIWNEMEKLKIENLLLQGETITLKGKTISIKDENENELAQMREKNECLNEQINKLKEENKRVRDENQLFNEKMNKLQPTYKILSFKSYELEKDRGKLRIKVLSGDGDLSSSKKMTKKLRNMGYKITLAGYAPRSNFLRNTVYFSPKFQNEAKRLVLTLGGNTIQKPLSWTSVFDLIVVTGKSPLRIVTTKK